MQLYKSKYKPNVYFQKIPYSSGYTIQCITLTNSYISTVDFKFIREDIRTLKDTSRCLGMGNLVNIDLPTLNTTSHDEEPVPGDYLSEHDSEITFTISLRMDGYQLTCSFDEKQINLGRFTPGEINQLKYALCFGRRDRHMNEDSRFLHTVQEFST